MFKRFIRDTGASVVPLFALSIIPILGFVGLAIDYSRASAARTAMQSALDSTALMLSRDATKLTSAQLTQKANDYFNALYKNKNAHNTTLTASYSSPQAGSFQLDIGGSAVVDTSFARVIGKNQINIASTSQVVWGIKRLEVALALDNTGSMASSNKMTELKKAAKSLLTTLQTAAKSPGDVKVAIIPFDTTVNIGTTYKNNNWFDIDSIDCNGWKKKGSGCDNNNWKQYWEGCVRDRTQPYDVQDTAPNPSDKTTLYPVYDCDSLVTAMPLSYDWTALKNKIDDMTPNGNTNVTIGLVWGWHALTSGIPFTEASAPANDLDKVIILLTDGENTEAWNNSTNQKITSSSTIDARTSAACTNIKAANIKIYTVRVINGDATLLKGCATNPSMYFDVQQASQLESVFATIAQNLANLRVSK